MPEPNAIPVHRYAKRLALRLWSVHAVRGAFLAAGCAAIALLIAAAVAQPVLTHTSALLVWSGAAVAALCGFATSLLPMRRYRGAKIAELVAQRDPALAHRLRSALELAAAPAGGSTQLVAAHVAQVERALGALPSQRVVPWTKALHAYLLLGALAVLGFAGLSYRQPALRAFVHALLQPASERADGTRVGTVVGHLHVKLTYPSYLARPPDQRDDPKKLSVPVGTSLEFEVQPVFAAERGWLLGGGPNATGLSVHRDGSLSGRLAAHKDGRLRIRIQSHGVRYEDPRAIVLHVTPDTSPTIRIETPHNGTLAPPNEALALRYTASDDVGISTVTLFARMSDGREKRRQLFSAVDAGEQQPQLRSGTVLIPAELGAVEGDTLTLWLEARDADLVTGPHVAKSEQVVLEVAQPGPGLSAVIPSLQQVADGAVDLLGDRLEHAVAKEAAPARARFIAIDRETHAWLDALDLLSKADTRTGSGAGMDLDQLRGMHRRNERLLRAEAALHAAKLRSYAERSAVDARAIDELERDAIMLQDLLAQAHIDEAKAIAQELRSLKKHIEELLDRLGKTDSPEAERALMQEIAKAQRRLAELAQSLSRMATRVPGEFVNRDAMHNEAAQSSLESLERAVQNHDLRAAAQHLESLAKQVDDLANQLNQGGLRLQESRFGPRDRALAQARQKLDMLSAEQDRLTERSGSIARDALSRMQGVEGRARSLAPQADALEQAARELNQGANQGWGSAAMGRAVDRLHDTHDALRAGDLAQARGMAQSAQRSLEQSAAELEGEARMFPGQGGGTARRAAAARRAAQDAQRLSEGIDRAMPSLGQHVNDTERQRMQADVESQRKAAQAAQGLQQSFEQGPDGLPLSPEGIDKLSAARESMRRAQRALERGRPQDANREQQQASDALQDLSRALAQNGSASPGSGADGASSGTAVRDTPVHIPGADEWKGPTQLRRRLLDAMHEGGPSAYEAAIDRYYQELLR